MAAVFDRISEPVTAPLARLCDTWATLDRRPAAVAFARTPIGILLIHCVFVVTLLAAGQISTLATGLVALVLAGCAFFPARRLAVMAWGGLLYICLRPYRTQQQTDFAERLKPLAMEGAELPSLAFQVPMVLLFLGVCFVVLEAQKRLGATVFGRRPFLCQVFAFAGLVAIGVALPAGTMSHDVLWAQVTILGASFFFLAYALAENRSKDDTSAIARLGFLRPFWGGPSVPFKGPGFLKKFEAADDDALAALRLRAMKLGIWALALTLAHRLLSLAFYDAADMPTLDQAIAALAAGEMPGRGLGWAVVGKNFLLNILAFGAVAHTLVAIVRMCGFGIPRHMARPLSSRTIAEFWNRYVYYFKEVLVDFFFYPAFVRWFKKSPRLRIAFATFCAAFVGNLLFSIVSQAYLFAEVGPVAALATFQSYAVYAFALTLALIASQLRNSPPRPEQGALRYHVLPRVNVLMFFALAQIFSDESGVIGVGERADFFLHLFGA